MKEGGNVPFTLDGKAVEAGPGETVLSVAKRIGVHIPTLCHHDAVSPYGACRLCVVEVFWGKRSKIVTSCIYTPYENDIVKTGTDRVRHTRRIVLELLLARCPQVEALHELGREYGVETPRFRADGPEREERCILCGLCIRVCGEVVGQHAIGYANRGPERVVTTPFADRSEECIGCGACVFVCPTGAIHYEDVDGARLMKEWKTELPLVRCGTCGEAFATERQVEKVRSLLNLPDEIAATCPRCRGTTHRLLMEKTLVSGGSIF